MSRVRRIVRLAASVSLVLLVIGAAHAQSAGAASKAVKAAAKAQLKLLRADLAAGVAEFDAAVDDFEEALLDDTPDLASAAGGLAADWGVLQVQGLGQILDHQTAFAAAAAEALAGFQEAAAGTVGPYPSGFHAGHGGGIDAFSAGWRKEQEKARAKMEARLLKAGKLLSKKAGLQLGVQTRVPVFSTGVSVNADFDSSASVSVGLFDFGVDLLLTLDPVDGLADAVVVVAGVASEGDGLDVTCEGSVGLPIFGDTTTADAGIRWSIVFTGVVEGNYIVTSFDSTSGIVRSDSLGVG